MKKRFMMQRPASIGLLLASVGLAAACGDGPGDDGNTGGMGGESTGGNGNDGSGGGTGGKKNTGGTAGTGGKIGVGGDEATGGDAGAGTGGQSTGGMGGSDGDPEPIAEIFAERISVAAALQAVSVTEDGLVYAVGTRVENTGTDEAPIDDPVVVVARFKSDGELDDTFGTGGVTILNVIAVADDDVAETTPGDEAASGVVALPDGGVAVSINANDGALGGDVLVARFDASGDLVPGFGVAGIAQVPFTDWTLGQAYTDAGGTTPPVDSSYDMRLDATGSEEALVLFGSAPALMTTGRIDSDRYVARILLGDGELDTSFADGGVYSIDFGNKNLNDSARRGAVLDDGSVVSFGYTVLEEARHHIFILKLDSEGVPVPGFGFRADETACGDAQAGVICSNPTLSAGGFAEAYGGAVQSDGSIVTTGYGRPDDQALPPDLVSFRFSATAMDATYGTAGGVIIDSGDEDRGRDIVVLPDDRLVHVGKYGAIAGIYVTDSEGALWDGFGDAGILTYPGHDGNFRAAATNGTVVAAVADGGSGTEAFLAIFTVGD